jgi:multiple sugar transport system substrate-binding protein
MGIKMAEITRRKLVGQAAALAGAASLAAPLANVATHTASAQDKTEITFYSIWGTAPGAAPRASKSPGEQAIDAFNAQSATTKVTLETPGGYAEILQKLQAQLAAGNPPALALITWSMLNYAREGLGIIDLETIGGDEVTSTLGASLKPIATDLIKVDDKHYGMPYGMSTPIIYYNADIFTEAGIDPATLFATWESFATEGKKLQKHIGGGPIVAMGGSWYAQTIIQSNGGRIVNDAGEFAFTEPEAKEATQTIADLDSAGLYDRTTEPEQRASFLGGSVPVMMNSVASINGLREEVTFTLGTSTFPRFGDKPRIPSNGGSFIGVFAQDEAQRKAAWEFLKYAVSEEGYTIWNKTGYLNISNYDLPILEGQEPAYEQLEEGLIRETNWPGARGAEAQQIWNEFLLRMWANDISVEEGVGEALAQIQSVAG